MNHVWIPILFFVFLGWLFYRLLLWFRRKMLKLDRSNRDPADLLLDTLREQTLKEREARELQAESEERLRRLALLHETILKNLPLGVMVLGRADRIDFVNEAAREWFEIPLEVPQAGQMSLESVSLRLAEGVRDLRQRGSGEEGLLTLEGGRGELVLQLGCYPLPSEQWLLTLRDRTRLQALEEQIQLKRELTLMGEMASGIAHEVKNGLALIQGRIQLLAYGDSESNKAQIQDEIDHLLRCVREFLKSSREEPLHREVHSAKAWLAEEEARWMRRPNGRRIRFQEVEETDQPLWLDAVMATVLLDNLIQNGLEACAEAGLSEEGPEIWVEVRLESQRQGWLLTVADQGPGFAPEVMRKLYVPFVSTKSKGTGLGMFHCRKIAKAHGGRLEVLRGDSELTQQDAKVFATRVCWFIPRGDE